MKANRDCGKCDHVYGKAVGLTTMKVRVTKKWFRKCFVCRSRQAFADMVRCVKCRVVVHDRCVCWQSYDAEATEKLRDRQTVDVATNTDVTITTDAATNTVTTKTKVAFTNTETVTYTDMSTSTEETVQIDVATNTETITSSVAATNTEMIETVDMSTNTDEETMKIDVATNTETTTTVATVVVTSVDVSTSTEEVMQIDMATNTETATTKVAFTNTETATYTDMSTSTEETLQIDMATNTETTTTKVASTNTETATTKVAFTNTETATYTDMSTSTEETLQIDTATNTETTTSSVAATNTEMIETVDMSTNTEETMRTEIATNTEVTVDFIDIGTNTEPTEKIDPAGTRSTNTESFRPIELIASSKGDVTTAVVAGDSVTSQDDGSFVTSITNRSAHYQIDKSFKSGPICALQELCMSRNWTLPKYRFFEEGDNTVFTFTVECTVLTCTTRVMGMLKKEGKRIAATLMYNKVKNIISCNGLLEKNSKKSALKNKSAGNGMSGDASSGSDEKLAIAEFVDKSVLTLGDDMKAAKVNKVSTLETSKEVVYHPASPTRLDTDLLVVTTQFPNRDENNVPSVNHSAGMAVNEAEKSLFSAENADLANRLRRSNNPSVQKLKELNSISTVPSCIGLVHQIVIEEGLAIEYDMTCPTSAALPIRNGFKTARLYISPGGLSVVGQGETAYHSQEDAAYKCLTRFKWMLEERL